MFCYIGVGGLGSEGYQEINNLGLSLSLEWKGFFGVREKEGHRIWMLEYVKLLTVFLV
jgi:hypothetical protein